MSTYEENLVEAPSAMSQECAEPAGDGGAGLVFWWLIFMAVVTFAPCMILPAWREYQAADLAERVGAHQVVTADAQLNDLRRRLKAIHTDPAVVARLARRELEFRSPGEDVVAVRVTKSTTRATSSAAQPENVSFEPAPPPVVIARLAAYLPNLNYDAVFCESPTRETVLAMSAGLFVTAFVVFWPRPRRNVPLSAHDDTAS